MSRSLTSTFHQAKNAQHREDPFAWLYEFHVPPAAGETDLRALRVTSYGTAIQFGTDSLGEPITFEPFPITNGVIRSSQSGDIVAIQVTVGNATREVGEVVDANNGLIDERVTVRIVNTESIANPQSVIAWRSRIADTTLTPKGVVFDLRPARLERAMIPGERYSSVRCRHEFGGARCGYLIPASPGESVGTGFSTCARTEEACTERGADETARGVLNRHPYPRWGAFPGIPRR